MVVSKRDLRAYSSVIDAAPDLLGDWVNELGSVMTISEQASGLLSGRYRSSVSQDSDPTGGRLTGVVAGDTLGFVVDWTPRFVAVTAWSGKLLAGPEGEPFIYSVWQLSGPMRNPAGWWESFLTGADLFRRADG